MALPPTAVEMAMGPGGPGMTAEEQMTEVQLPLIDDLPEGIMLAGNEEMVEVQTEVYNHNANLAEVLDDSILGSLSSDLSGKIDEDKSSREEWEEAIARGLTLLGINYEERNEPVYGCVWCNTSVVVGGCNSVSGTGVQGNAPAGWSCKDTDSWSADQGG